jgi:Ankyrin repeat
MSDQLKSASEKDSYYVNEDDSEESIDDCDDSYDDNENNEFEEDNNDSKDVLKTAFDQLKLELEKWPPDFEKVRQIISANKHLVNEPIGDNGEYVLHYACLKNAPSNIVIEFIHVNPLAVQQKNDDGCYPLHLACENYQSESVIQNIHWLSNKKTMMDGIDCIMHVG